MSGLIRRIRRTNKKAAKYQFTATLQELHLTARDEAVHPKAVVVSFQHRRRISSSKERTWEKSFTNPSQAVIVWPEQTPDTIEILTTLYKGANDEAFEDKAGLSYLKHGHCQSIVDIREWTIVVDEITAKNRRRPIAAVPLNMRLFIHDHPGSRSQLKLKLRPLSPQIEHASMVLTLAANLINERDDMSMTSSRSGRTTREQSVVDGVGAEGEEASQPVDPKAVADIARISDEIEKKFGEKKEEKEKKKKDEPERKESDKIRPPWRVDEKKDQVLAQLEKFPTEAFFEVGSDSVPHQMPAPPSSLITSIDMRGKSPRASSRQRQFKEGIAAVPEKKEGEELMAWCKRVTGDYPGFRINDFGKSFSSGLALCALIHAYRPELTGDFNSLDFSKTLIGSKKNVKLALSCASSLGVQALPDDSEITTPDTKQIRLLVERLRRLLEGSTELPTPLSESDHRISRMYFVNDDEKGVIAEVGKLKDEATAFQSPAYRGVTKEDQEMAIRTLEREKKEKKQRAGLSYDTFTQKDDGETTVPEPDTVLPVDQPTMTSPSQSREAHDPFASSSSEEKEKEEQRREETRVNGGENGVDEVDGDGTKKEELRDMTMLTPTLPRKLSTGRTSQSKQEEYRKKAREMLSNPQAAVAQFSTPPSGAADDRRRDAARQLLADAQSEGATFVIHPTANHHHQRAGSSSGAMTSSTIQPSTLKKFPSRTSLGGSATDLRRVELVSPSPVPLHKFKKRDPSPALSRKIYDNGETPHVPAISASREDVSSRVVNVVTSFRRHGSMRADELKDLVYDYAQKFSTPSPSSVTSPDRAATLPATPNTQNRGHVTATPTRKVVSQWEKDVADEERTTREQETIAEELLRITAEIRAREAVIRDAGLAPGSEEEQRLVEDLVRLANDKNGMVIKQAYYNEIENLRESTKRFNALKSELDAVAAQDFCKTEEEKQRTDELMKKYMAEVETKNDLMQRLFAAEDKLLDDDEDEFASSSLQRGASLGGVNFVRGAPVSASRRIAQGLQNWLQG